ncbi:MAG: diaminopimelate epimerase [Proteobacteria bacterium]|nr:diaminopimelate epimerase [Pseudomonadota bacterium]
MLAFTKLHGLGNDFILLDGREHPLPEWVGDPSYVKRLCDRRRGIGADGLLLVLPTILELADARMRVLNADGSEPQMCGNGLRCAAKYLHDHAPGPNAELLLRIETQAGIRPCQLQLAPNGLVAIVRADMGRPEFARETLPMRGSGPFVEEALDLEGLPLIGTALSLGNPHFVTFVEDQRDLRALAAGAGPRVEQHAAFPQRTNVEFVRVTPEGALEVSVWERGCGLTEACGTGACAAAAAAIATRRVPGDAAIEVRLPGGTLMIEAEAALARIWMAGPAEEVYSGELPAPDRLARSQRGA